MKIPLTIWLVLAIANDIDGARKIRPEKQARRLERKRIKFSLKKLSSELGLTGWSNFNVKGTYKTAQGRYKNRLKQRYGDYEVVGGAITAEYQPGEGYNGMVAGEMFVSLDEDIGNPNRCNQTDDTVARIALEADGVAASQVSRLNVKKNVLVLDAKGRLTYEVNFNIISEGRRMCYFVDACDLKIIFHFSNIQDFPLERSVNTSQADIKERSERQSGCDTGATNPPTSTETTEATTTEATTTEATTETTTTSATTTEAICSNPAEGVGGNTKIGRIFYGTDVCLDNYVSGSTCILENDYLAVIDMDQTTDTRFKGVASYTCSQGYDDEVNGGYSAVLDALYLGTLTVQMFLDWYNRTPLGRKFNMYVHYDRSYENAFWDGESLFFGDGDSVLFPLVGLDIVAHEAGHGVTDRYSDLVYSGQSGGINEAFSDLTGETVDAFARGTTDWKLGADIVKPPRETLRYLDDPTKDGRSIDHVSDYYNGLGVHYSSGIFNKAFYNMVTGRGIMIRRAYECFLDANENHWTRFTGFEDGACGVVESAYDLGYDFIGVKSSFELVGITFNNCPLSSIITSISTAQTLQGIIVSTFRNPVFLLDPPQGATQVEVIVTASGNEILVVVLDDLEAGALVSGVNQLTYDLTPPPLYVRLSATSEVDITGVSMQVTFL